MRLAELALADFSDAARLDDDSEYPHVASLQVAVEAIELEYRLSGCKSHAEFFSRPANNAFRTLLERAEESVESIVLAYM